MRIAINGAQRLLNEKAAAVEEVNRLVDQARRLFITPIVGQEMIYMEKEVEAKLFLAEDPTPVDTTDYPFISAETGVTAPTAYEVAQLYVNLGAQWRVVGSALENLRLTSVSAIQAATSPAEVTAAVDQAATAIQGFYPLTS